MMSPTPRIALAALLMASAAIFLQFIWGSEVVPQPPPLKQLPEQLDTWTGTDLPIEKDELEVLGHGDFLLRDYENQQPQPGMNLFIAYYATQRTGETPHSPQHCLPGSGWTPVENKRITLSMPGHVPFPVNRYIIANGDSRQIVLYWFWAHNRGVASEYAAKYYLVHDSMTMHRSDGSLIRIISEMRPDESIDAAQQRVLPFAAEILPQLNTYIPR